MVESSDSDSDSDIEIIATKDVKNRLLLSSERHETIRDLEDIESQDGPIQSTSRRLLEDDINISISKDAFRKAKNVNIKISIDTDDTDTDDKREDVISIASGFETEEFIPHKWSMNLDGDKTTGKRKQELDYGIVCSKKKVKSSTASMSTSEIVLQKVQSAISPPSPEPEPVSPVSVHSCADSFINSCRRILKHNDFEAVSRKIKKNLSKLDPAHHYNISLKNFLDSKWSLLDLDHSNIFIHVKEVIEELKRYKGINFSTTSSGGNTSDPSEADNFETQIPAHLKKRVSLTTLSSENQMNKSSSLGSKNVDNRAEKDKLNNSDSEFPEKNNSDEELLISLSLEKKSPCRISEQSTQDKTNIKVFNKSLSSSNDKASGSSKNVSEKHILKLEKALRACAKEIKKCEEAEIDWENDQDSNFIMADKWKKKFMRIHNKLAEYSGTERSLDRSLDKKFKFSDSLYPEINKKIERFVNKTQTFPDFWDIKKQIEKVNVENKLKLQDIQIHNEAEKIFIAIGKKLKKRRNIDDGNVMYSYLRPDDSGDPADQDAELDTKLVQLGKVAEMKINRVFEEFVEKQVNRGLSEDEEVKTDEEENEITLENIQNKIDSDEDNEVVTIENINCQEKDICEDPKDDEKESEDELNSSNGSLNDLLDESE